MGKAPSHTAVAPVDTCTRMVTSTPSPAPTGPHFLGAQAITMMHVLLTNTVVQEAAVEDVPCEESGSGSGSESGSESGSGSGGRYGSSEVSSSETKDPAATAGGGSSSSSPSKKSRKRSFLRTCLVLVPKNVLRNWEEELKMVRTRTHCRRR